MSEEVHVGADLTGRFPFGEVGLLVEESPEDEHGHRYYVASVVRRERIYDGTTATTWAPSPSPSWLATPTGPGRGR